MGSSKASIDKSEDSLVLLLVLPKLRSMNDPLVLAKLRFLPRDAVAVAASTRDDPDDVCVDTHTGIGLCSRFRA